MNTNELHLQEKKDILAQCIKYYKKEGINFRYDGICNLFLNIIREEYKPYAVKYQDMRITYYDRIKDLFPELYEMIYTVGKKLQAEYIWDYWDIPYTDITHDKFRIIKLQGLLDQLTLRA